MEEILQRQIDFIKEQVRLQGRSGVILGLSGGIDSAVVAAVAVKALGAENVKCLVLPDLDSSFSTVEDAQLVADALGIVDVTVKDITPLVKASGAYDLFPELYDANLSRDERGKKINEMKAKVIAEKSKDMDFLSYYRTNAMQRLRDIRSLWNTKIRLRMSSIYMEAERFNLLVLGTTNKTEYQLGWFTKYGDGATDVELLYPLYKNEVFEFARFLEIPEKIIDKKPSGDILPGVDDEMGIGVPYSILDAVLEQLEQGKEVSVIAAKLNVDVEIAVKIQGLIKSSHYSKIVPINFE